MDQMNVEADFHPDHVQYTVQILNLYLHIFTI